MDNYEEYYNAGELIVKYLRDELTHAELEKLNSWRKADEENEKLFVRLTTRQYFMEELSRYRSGNDKEEVFARVLAGINKGKRKPLTFMYRRYIGYAAAVTILLGIAYLYLPFGAVRQTDTEVVAQELLPGGNKAVLVLDDGKEIDLDQAGTGEIARQGYAIISKSEEGYIAYDLRATGEAVQEMAPTRFNTISTPKGGQYMLRLPDGSKVWLNSLSSLRFPVRFDRRERKVELSGEAYFEVVPGKEKPLPFKVISGSQTVEVLGTEFNVNGYSDEGNITTTLLTGKVRVGLLPGDAASGAVPDVTLLPGQKASVEGQAGTIRVSEADIEESIAWKNGKFQFNDTELGTIMRQISRWYDVEVEYRGEVEHLRFKGKASRDVPASHVFEILKATGINIKTEGRKIIVSI